MHCDVYLNKPLYPLLSTGSLKMSQDDENCQLGGKVATQKHYLLNASSIRCAVSILDGTSLK